MSGAGAGEIISTFNTNTYIFNGHGSALVKKDNNTEVTFTVPENTYYILSTKCGKKSFIASVDILISAQWRNAGLDQIPPAKTETEKVAAYKEELRQIIGLDSADDIEIFYPGDTPQDGTFTPISNIGSLTSKTCKLDGYCGLIHRESISTGNRVEKVKARERTLLNKIKDLSKYFEFSVKPTKEDVKKIQGETKTIETAGKVAKTTFKFGDLVNEFKGTKDKASIFINPLCRVIEKIDGGRRTYRRNKKLKRQTRRRR
jgi:hypothetical protein